MIDSLNIGVVVYDRLKTIAALKNSIYPIIAENGASLPFAVYQRNSITPTFCKDGCYEDYVNLTIKIVSATYHQGINIANDVRKQMTMHNYNTDTMTINSEFSGGDESYENDEYVQTLNFNITINNK